MIDVEISNEIHTNQAKQSINNQPTCKSYTLSEQQQCLKDFQAKLKHDCRFPMMTGTFEPGIPYCQNNSEVYGVNFFSVRRIS